MKYDYRKNLRQPPIMAITLIKKTCLAGRQVIVQTMAYGQCSPIVVGRLAYAKANLSRQTTHDPGPYPLYFFKVVKSSNSVVSGAFWLAVNFEKYRCNNLIANLLGACLGVLRPGIGNYPISAPGAGFLPQITKKRMVFTTPGSFLSMKSTGRQTTDLIAYMKIVLNNFLDMSARLYLKRGGPPFRELEGGAACLLLVKNQTTLLSVINFAT